MIYSILIGVGVVIAALLVVGFSPHRHVLRVVYRYEMVKQAGKGRIFQYLV